MFTRVRPVALVAAAAVVALVALTAPPVGATGTGEPPGTPTAHRFAGTPTVGALFQSATATAHTCTASVIDSPKGDLLITAAHCIDGNAAGMSFVPAYRKGIEPYGSWRVVAAYGAPGWIAHQRQQRDFAILVVAAKRLHGKEEQIQDVTGGNELGLAPTHHEPVTVPAYDAGSNDRPITCTSGVYLHRGFPAFNCTPYLGGTSGSPWLYRDGHGRLVVGVIGGLHQGGCYAYTSYSAAFGPATLRTYDRAIEDGPASTFPKAGGDGCTTGL